MTTPNLYDFATKELSQDATIAYILAWADPKYRKLHPQLHALGTELLCSLLCTQEMDIPIIKTLQIKTQVPLRIKTQDVRIDILVRINVDQNTDRIILIIEDKVGTTEHLNQIERYKEAVEKRYSGSYDHLVAVYLKTGKVLKEELPSKDICGHFLRRDLLDVLDGFQNTKDTIVDNFRTHLQRWEDDINRMESGYYENDTVTKFARKVADLVRDGLLDDIKPKGKSRFAQDYGHRSYSLWYKGSQERRRYYDIGIELYYEIGITPSEDNQSCTDAFVAIWYNIHDAALINTLERLDIQENQWHDIENDKEGRIRVDYGKKELNDDFVKTLAKTLRRFIKVATPAVDAFVNERNEDDA